jgi:hypothetical protein
MRKMLSCVHNFTDLASLQLIYSLPNQKLLRKEGLHSKLSIFAREMADTRLCKSAFHKKEAVFNLK